jgi:hypothetical protein
MNSLRSTIESSDDRYSDLLSQFDQLKEEKKDVEEKLELMNTEMERYYARHEEVQVNKKL